MDGGNVQGVRRRGRYRPDRAYEWRHARVTLMSAVLSCAVRSPAFACHGLCVADTRRLYAEYCGVFSTWWRSQFEVLSPFSHNDDLGVFDYRIRIRIHTESRFRFGEKVHSNNESESGFRYGETYLRYYEVRQRHARSAIKQNCIGNCECTDLSMPVPLTGLHLY